MTYIVLYVSLLSFYYRIHMSVSVFVGERLCLGEIEMDSYYVTVRLVNMARVYV